MKAKILPFVGVVAVVLAARIAFSDTVPTDGLLAAVAAAKDGDVLQLGVGTYEIDDEFTLDKRVTISGAGIDQTIIRQKGANKRVLALDNAGAKVEYCTLTGGSLTSERAPKENDMGGCGVLIGANGGTLSFCRITDNKTNQNQNRATGIDEHSSDALIENCIIDNNVVTGGSNGTLAGIRAYYGTYRRCLIVDNKGHNGGGVYTKGPAKFISCTIAGNHAPDGMGAVALGSKDADAATFTDCIIAGNFTSATDTSTKAPEYCGGDARWGTGWGNFANCAFPNSVTVDASILKGTPFQCDVHYADPANGDYRLRLVSGAKDIGYYAPFDYDTFACDFLVSTDALFVGETVSFESFVTGYEEGDALEYAWTVTQPDGMAKTLSGERPDFMPEQPGYHSVRLAVTKNGAGALAEYVQADCFLAATAEANVATTAELLAAIRYAKNGTVITCAAGTYELTDQITLGKGIKIYGAGRDVTFFKQTALKQRVLEMDHENDAVYDVTICGGNSGANMNQGRENLSGLGVYMGAHGGTLERCAIINNTNVNNRNDGVGIYMLAGLVSHCVITNNHRLNGSNQYGGGVRMSGGTLDNCLIADNLAWNGGGGVYASGKCSIRNCTIVNNSTPGGSGGGLYWSSQDKNSQFVNCLFALNKTAASDATVAKPEIAGNSDITVTSCSFPATVVTSALKGTPLNLTPIFVDSDNGDYHLQNSSPTVNAGVDYAELSETDLDGNPRKSGATAVDLGCYEYDATKFNASFEGPADPRGFINVSVPYKGSVSGVDEQTSVAYDWTVRSPSGKETKAVTQNMTLTPDEYGVWAIAMTATAGGVTSEPFTATYSVCPPDLYVVEPTAENIAKAQAPFDDWGNASTNLIELMRDWALPGCTIHLGEGTIPVDQRVDLASDIKLIGQGWTKTTLRQTRVTTSVLYLNHEKALARGMTITGFSADKEVHSRGAVMIEANGGTVEDCRITGNRYTVGGGINQQCGVGITVNGEKAFCRRCIIDRNEGKVSTNNNRGGGVQMIKGLLESCLVCFNTNQYAAGISIGSSSYPASNPTVRNCTVYGNVATGVDSTGIYGPYGVGGIGQFSGNATIENTIVFGNASPNQNWETGGYPEWRTNGGTLTFRNCLLPEGVDWPAGAADCLNGDPLFADAAAEDFHLTAPSPAAYKGLRLDYTAESKDLDGNPRIYNFKFFRAKPDLGCYESPYGAPGLMLLVR